MLCDVRIALNTSIKKISFGEAKTGLIAMLGESLGGLIAMLGESHLVGNSDNSQVGCPDNKMLTLCLRDCHQPIARTHRGHWLLATRISREFMLIPSFIFIFIAGITIHSCRPHSPQPISSTKKCFAGQYYFQSSAASCILFTSVLVNSGCLSPMML